MPHVVFEPLDFIARLVALVPGPKVNLTRYHGVFAPHSQYRALVTPAMGGRKKSESTDKQTPAERRASMTWVQRLKRVFNIDIETCGERRLSRYGGLRACEQEALPVCRSARVVARLK